MAEFAKEIVPINLEDEMKQSYLDYAMSVIVGRALPDVRDGLKPVHRRVLYAMSVLNNEYNKPYKKSARVVGDVIGKYHPHGDTAVYDTIVRMAQPFSLRYMLIDGQGNFGSVDGDNAAAMRYTEVRMARITTEMLADLDKETVDFVPNYDGNESEPSVLPARLPNLLINGSSGIAVGMATNIPPHNITEVINACIATIENADISLAELMEILPGPDFPTAGYINGARGIQEAYSTGRGKIYVRAKTHIEEKKGRETIIVTELPYQVNKAVLIQKIHELARDKKIEGISMIREESDKDGMRVAIKLKRGEVSDVVLNNLYKQTQMQTVFGINIVALTEGQPKILNLKQLLSAFIQHRREVVTRRTVYDLRRARERNHILEGLAVALANIDEVIALIKKSSGPKEAKASLVAKAWEPGAVEDMLARASESARVDGISAEMGLGKDGYRLSDAQAQAILELRLQKLTGLEQDKIIAEYKALLDEIDDLLDILSNPDRLMSEIRQELESIREQYGDERRTEIIHLHQDLQIEDLITEEDVVVTLSHAGYAKAQPVTVYSSQRRGGKGKAATSVREEDFIDKLFVANTHDTILCFSSRGKAYWLKVYELPQASRIARGKPIVNLLPLEKDERINAVLPVHEFSEDKFIFMATANGTVKKTPLSHFSRPRSSGIIAVELREGDYLVNVTITDGERDVMLITNAGKAIRFNEKSVRQMGRTACGVRGIKLAADQKVISLINIDEDGSILTATANGYGKRTKIDDYPVHGRGGQGVIAIQISERNGDVVSAVQVEDDHEFMMISNLGTLVRTRVEEVSVMGRNTQGVRLINIGEGDRLVGVEPVARFEEETEDESDDDNESGAGSDNASESDDSGQAESAEKGVDESQAGKESGSSESDSEPNSDEPSSK
ncbi:DNA gyrase subunit A [hydrothermal vent metagenome]|uniref:DNA topoisomerase (ATP-hydrolyzing) n=1 Tax=hydrothermal vent metagenome TaxID=652676 RepID=A0A3B0YAW6_9ZZZZ